MKEFNFSNANLKTEDNTLFFTNRIKEDEDIKFDSTSILLEEFESSANVVANYSLISFESLIAEKITIRNDLTCYKHIECETLNVSGNLRCYGNINVKEIYINGESVINNGFIKNGKLNSNLIATGSLEIAGELCINGSVVCNEGILGDGKLSCEYVYANDYLEIEVENGAIKNREIVEDKQIVNCYDKLLIKLQDSENIIEFIHSDEYKEAIKNIELISKEIKQIIPSLDTTYENKEIMQIFKSLTQLDINYKLDYVVLKFIEKIQDNNKINDLHVFLKLVNYREKTHEYMMGLDECRYVFNQFLENQKKNIENMNTDSIETNEDFAKALNLVEINSDYFTREEYEKILSKLYGKIGITLKLVSKNLELSL